MAELMHLSFSQDEFRASGHVKAWVNDSDIPSDISDNDLSGVGEGDLGVSHAVPRDSELMWQGQGTCIVMYN